MMKPGQYELTGMLSEGLKDEDEENTRTQGVVKKREQVINMDDKHRNNRIFSG